MVGYFGDKTNLLDRRLVGAWAREHVADLGYLALGCDFDEFLAVRLAGCVFEGLCYQINPRGIGMGNQLAIRAGARWVEVAVLKATLALADHRERLGLVALHSDDDLFEH